MAVEADILYKPLGCLTAQLDSRRHRDGLLINSRHGSMGRAAVECRRAVGHAALSATIPGGYLDHVAVLARKSHASPVSRKDE